MSAGLTCRVFIGAEVRLDVGFNVACARMANLARGGLLRGACDDADLRPGLAAGVVRHRAVLRGVVLVTMAV
jgi:hypothetical protein